LGCVGLAALLYWRNVHTPHAIAATFREESGLAVWSIEVDSRGSHLTVHAAALRAKPVGYSYELWALPEEGKPVSLVPLPAGGTATYDLNPAQTQALARARQVAVTVEVRGSSLTGRRVILKASLQSV
jgi:anti-sigma-K factor RskA